jgi:L-methionine (R)-S-oxide reductase
VHRHAPAQTFRAERLYTSWLTITHAPGFYIDASVFPTPQLTTCIAKPESTKAGGNIEEPSTRKLLLGPFCGKPACQFINVTPGKSRGVCADAFMKQESVLVHDVNTYPGHIACDGETNSELVCPLSVLHRGRRVAVGVLDMDCVGLGGFDDDDRRGAEKVADLVSNACKW